MGGFYEADLRTCEEVGMTMSKRQFYALAGVPIREIFPHPGGGAGQIPGPRRDGGAVQGARGRDHGEGPALIEPVVAIAREAKRLGVPIAVASSGCGRR